MSEVEDLRRRVKELETIVAMDKAFQDLKFQDVTEEQIRDVMDAPELRQRITDLEAQLAAQPKPWKKPGSAIEMLVDEKRLPGIKVHVATFGPEVRAVFVENRDGKFAAPCPHCAAVYWYHPGEVYGETIPEDCHRALYEANGGKWEDRNKQPWESQDAAQA